MKIGTKSLLFGVHQFLWHPICVARAWRLLYQRWPTRYEWLSIILHDVGYWGCSDMDGQSGRDHPARGAHLVRKAVEFCVRRKVGPRTQELLGYSWWLFCIGHSCHYAEASHVEVSQLYYADKVAALMEPVWFYLLRAWLSGEGKEFRSNCAHPYRTTREWFQWYREKVASENLTFRPGVR